VSGGKDMTDIIVLAVTRLSSGVCIAGITTEREWVRPTRPTGPDWRQLEYSDCKDKSGQWVICKGNVVAMDLVKAIPMGAHTEDWLVGDRPPELVEELSDEDYQGICQELTEDSTDAIKSQDATRSLIMVHPSRITSFLFGIEGQKRYTPRCAFRVGGSLYQGVAVSDAEWRTYGRRQRRKQQGDCRITGQKVFAELDVDDCWFTLGRNEYKSSIYLMVIGVHLFPPRRFPRDFKR